VIVRNFLQLANNDLLGITG